MWLLYLCLLYLKHQPHQSQQKSSSNHVILFGTNNKFKISIINSIPKLIKIKVLGPNVEISLLCKSLPLKLSFVFVDGLDFPYKGKVNWGLDGISDIMATPKTQCGFHFNLCWNLIIQKREYSERVERNQRIAVHALRVLAFLYNKVPI